MSVIKIRTAASPTTMAMTAPVLRALVLDLVSTGVLEPGSELGFDGTTTATGGGMVQAGKGLRPQSPALPAKAEAGNFSRSWRGTWPESSLLETFKSRKKLRSGNGPDRMLFCRRRVTSRVRFRITGGIDPRRLLSEASSLTRRLSRARSAGIRPEKSLEAK